MIFRPLSGMSYGSRPRSGRKSIFKNLPHLMKAYAYVNGSREKFMYLAAPNMKIVSYVIHHFHANFYTSSIDL